MLKSLAFATQASLEKEIDAHPFQLLLIYEIAKSSKIVIQII